MILGFFQCQVGAEPRSLKSLPIILSAGFLIISRSIEDKFKWSGFSGGKKKKIHTGFQSLKILLLLLGVKMFLAIFSETRIICWLFT